MASKNWSSSRIKTYQACLLKYYYTYIKPYDSNQPVNDTLSNKGLCFHETAEQMESGKTDDEMKAILESKIAEYKVDRTVFPEDEALRRFLLFWKEYIIPKENDGYFVAKEDWAKGFIENKSFVGALDLFIKGPLELEVPDDIGYKLISENRATLAN